jgi:2-dehydropantoate 2-reductase
MGAYKPSTLVDFEEGKPLEIEAIWGEPLRRAKAAGAKMPHLQELYDALKSLRPLAKEAKSGQTVAKA